MADIFVSYARADKERVAPIVAALQAQGWSVWWDPAIIPGQEFDDLIAEEIDNASAVVVVWTPTSVASRWVRGEAREAADRGILVPVRFEQARLPIDVRAVHTTDLDDWKEDAGSPQFKELVSALSLLLKNAKPQAALAEPEPRETSICVLPFVNMSGDPEQEYFSDGLSEELLNQLAQLKGLKVAARTSSFAFKGQNPDLKEVSQKLGVEHVLEGSVRKAGNRLRITAQLIDASSGYHLWSDTFNRELDDVFQIQEDIARAVADALKIALGMEESTLLPGGTRNVEAYDLYLRAQALGRQASAQGFQRAIALLREAVELDPCFAMAWATLAAFYINAVVHSPETAAESRRLSAEAFERAKACAPEAAQIHVLEAAQLTIQHDWIRASEAWDKARTLSQGKPVGDVHPFFLICVGRTQDAIKGYEELRRSDPLMTNLMYQVALDMAARYDEAEAEYKRSLTLPIDPNLPEYFALLRTMAREGSQTVKLQLRRYVALNAGYMPIHGELLEKFDDKAAVREILHGAFEDPFYQDASHMDGLGQMAAYFGDDELALACERRGLVEMNGVIVASIWLPVFAAMRKSEGFKDLVRDLGLYDYWRKSGKWGDFTRPVGDDDFEIVR